MASVGSGRTQLTLLVVVLIVLVAGFGFAGYLMDRQLDQLQSRMEQVYRDESEPKVHPAVVQALDELTQMQAVFQDELVAMRDIAETSQRQAGLAHQTAANLQDILADQSAALALVDQNLSEIITLIPEETALSALAQAETARLTQESISEVYYLLCHALHHQPVERVFYPVGPGDNLWSISARFTGNPGLYNQIAQENNLIDNSMIRPGQWVWIPTRLLSATLRETLPALIPPQVASICGPLEIGINI